MKRTLGTQLRHLLDLLDGAVGQAYIDAGMDFRPRYTPVMRALMEAEPLTIGGIAQAMNSTQPAATQTVAMLIDMGLVVAESAPKDARQKLIRLSLQGRALLPKLDLCWQATASAANSLDADLQLSLSDVLERAIDELTNKSFGARIQDARDEATQAASRKKSSVTTSRAAKGAAKERNR